MASANELCGFVSSALAAAANPGKAVTMAAYMKTEMPFYGVQKAGRTPVFRELKKRFAPADRAEYEANVLALWALPHREEKYASLFYARSFKRFVVPASLPLYERLIREGAWWDLVDEVAPHLVGGLLLADRDTMTPLMRAWSEDDDVWIRRSSIICQLKHKEKTDTALLFELCRARAHEPIFWIRKAIGWSLRQHARTDAETVRAFLEEYGDELSGLSRREASKHL